MLVVEYFFSGGCNTLIDDCLLVASSTRVPCVSCIVVWPVNNADTSIIVNQECLGLSQCRAVDRRRYGYTWLGVGVRGRQFFVSLG